MILAGDIGGTNTRLALFASEGKTLRHVAETTYGSRDHNSLEEIVEKFLAKYSESVERGCLGIAGPVQDGRVKASNLPWLVDAKELSRRAGIAQITLINDLEATAHGIASLQPEEFVVLSPGEADAKGNAAVIAAGTGLGEAVLYWDGSRHRPFACEGGHGDFAPRSDLELELFRYLRTEFGRVSYERVLSGPGLHNIYRFLRDTGRGTEPPWLTEQMQQGDPSATISRAALAGTSSLCVEAIELFVSIYGAEAGNLALKVMARAGMYLGGGIAPKILGKLKSGTFMESFWTKGRMRVLLQTMPVRVILNDKTALMGAARFAMLEDSSELSG